MEDITFMVLEESTADIILGCLWLNQHQPHVQWNMGKILKWCDSCFTNCLSSIKKSPTKLQSSSDSKVLPVLSTSIESPEMDLKIEIPPEYRTFQDVLSK